MKLATTLTTALMLGLATAGVVQKSVRDVADDVNSFDLTCWGDSISCTFNGLAARDPTADVRPSDVCHKDPCFNPTSCKKSCSCKWTPPHHRWDIYCEMLDVCQPDWVVKKCEKGSPNWGCSCDQSRPEPPNGG